jgi:hypothetical protein
LRHGTVAVAGFVAAENFVGRCSGVAGACFRLALVIPRALGVCGCVLALPRLTHVPTRVGVIRLLAAGFALLRVGTVIAVTALQAGRAAGASVLGLVLLLVLPSAGAAFQAGRLAG